MNLSDAQVENLASIIGARDHAALAAELEEILSAYELRRWVGRDTLPTAAEAHQTSKEIEERLAWVVEMLIGKGQNPFLAVWLSGALTGNDKGPMFEFPGAVIELLKVVRRVNADFERNAATPLEMDGELHHRKTRTNARDKILIPMLVLCAQIHGDPDLVGDLAGDDTAYEAVDTICEFLTATMNAVGIPAPDAGDTMHGEVNQGRLRRMVKAAFKEHRAIRESTLDK